MSKICGVCKRELNLFSSKVKLTDGYVCKNCLNRGAITEQFNLNCKSTQEVQKLVETRAPIANNFHTTRKVLDNFKIDETHKAIKIDKDLFLYSDLFGYELTEDGVTLSHHTLGQKKTQTIKNSNGKTATDVLSGMISNIVGTKKVLELTISFSNTIGYVKTIKFSRGDERISKEEYERAIKKAKTCTDVLDVIISELDSHINVNQINHTNILVDNSINHTSINQAQDDHASSKATDALSRADALLKYKQLLDLGIITEQDFNRQKQLLLNETYCEHCGTRIETTSNFCTNCGFATNQSTANNT